jgi:hypothetical protein
MVGGVVRARHGAWSVAWCGHGMGFGRWRGAGTTRLCESNMAALSDYPNLGLSVLFPSLHSKYQGKTHISQSLYFYFCYVYSPLCIVCAVCVEMCTVLLPPGVNQTAVNPLTPNSQYAVGHTAPLSSRRCILNIYSTNIRTEYFKRAA